MEVSAEKPGQARGHGPWRGAVVGSAAVAGAFTLIVCGLLVYACLAQRLEDPVNSPHLAALRAELAAQPKNAQLKESIQALDRQLRLRHLRLRQFAQQGVYLLVGGAVAFLAAIRAALAFRRRLPMPQVEQDPRGQAGHAASMARWSVAALGVVIIGAGAILGALSRQAVVEAPQPVISPAASAPPASAEEFARNWPCFRGPTGGGISPHPNAPTRWNGKTGEGVLWKSPIPIHGENSPIVWGKKVFLTGATARKRHVYCFDAADGRLLWERSVEVPGGPTEAPRGAGGEDSAGFAAPTAATDGARVYAIFANGDVACLDFGGVQVWARNLGLPDSAYGYASSLTVYGSSLLIQFDQGEEKDEKSRLLALDGMTGKTLWETPRPGGGSWSSPVVVDTPGGKQLIACGTPFVIAYDPGTGLELWRAECLSRDMAPSPVAAGGVVYAVNAGAVLAAIRPDGSGDVTGTHILWKGEDGLPDICSPLADGKVVLLLTSGGTLTCYAAADGRKLWEQDLETSFRSSPSLAGGRVYLTSTEGVTYIISAGAEYRELGRCELGEPTNACPAFTDGRIYIRGKRNLYCIGSAGGSASGAPVTQAASKAAK